ARSGRQVEHRGDDRHPPQLLIFSTRQVKRSISTTRALGIASAALIAPASVHTGAQPGATEASTASNSTAVAASGGTTAKDIRMANRALRRKEIIRRSVGDRHRLEVCSSFNSSRSQLVFDRPLLNALSRFTWVPRQPPNPRSVQPCRIAES